MTSDRGGRGGECLAPGAPFLREKTIGGLHDFILREVLPHYAPDSGPAIDLGAGSGALAVRLRSAGWDVWAADIDRQEYKADSTVYPGRFGRGELFRSPGRKEIRFDHRCRGDRTRGKSDRSSPQRHPIAQTGWAGGAHHAQRGQCPSAPEVLVDGEVADDG